MTDDDVELWVRLAEAGLPPDFQGLLIYGDAERGIAPKILFSSLRSAGWQKVPAGYAVVPREPTEKMLRAGRPYTEGDYSLPDSLYRAMIEAAKGE